MDRFEAMRMFVRVVQSGSFSLPRVKSVSVSHSSASRSPNLKRIWVRSCCGGLHAA